MRIFIACFITMFLVNTCVIAQQPFIGTFTDSAAKKTYMVMQIESEFPGGIQGWMNYLQNNLNTRLGNKYIKIPKGELTARQTAKVSFIVSKNGDITDIEVTNKDSIHPKLAEEAIRVIKEGPKWTPAQQASVLDIPGLTEQQRIDSTYKKGLPKVTSRKHQAITWQVSKD